MIIALLFLSIFVFIPGAAPLVDAFDLPKTAVVGALATAIWIDLLVRAHRDAPLQFPLLGPIVVFVGLSALSGLNAINTHYFLYALGAQIAGVSFFWYGANMKSSLSPLSFLSSTQKTQKTQQTQQTLSVLWLAPACVAVVAIVAVVVNRDAALAGVSTFGNQERGSGIVALAIGIVAFKVQGSRFKVLGSLLLVPLLLFLWIGQMRSATVGLAIGLAVWLWPSMRGSPIFRVGALAAMGGATIYFLSSMFNDGRPAIWTAALREIRPLGIGLGQWRLYAQAWIHDVDLGGQYYRELYNDYLQLLVEAGPLALVAFLYLLYKILFNGSNVQGSTSPLIVGLIAVLVNAFFLFPFQLPIEAAWFWLVAGIYQNGEQHA